MKTKIFEKSATDESLTATFENYNVARNWAILAAGVNMFDYVIRNGKRNEEVIRSKKRVKCPGCGADYTFNELSPRFKYGHKLCDCNTRFYVHNLTFNGETCEKYID